MGPALLWRITLVSSLIGGATIAVFLIEIAQGMSLELARTWLIPLGIAAGAFLVIEAEKALTRRLLSKS